MVEPLGYQIFNEDKYMQGPPLNFEELENKL